MQQFFGFPLYDWDSTPLDPPVEFSSAAVISGTTDADGDVTLASNAVPSTPGATLKSSVWMVNGQGAGDTGPAGNTFDKGSRDDAFDIYVWQVFEVPAGGFLDTPTRSTTISVEAASVPIDFSSPPTISGTTGPTGLVTLAANAVPTTPGATRTSSVWMVDDIPSGSTDTPFDKGSRDDAFEIYALQTFDAPGSLTTEINSTTISVEAVIPLIPDPFTVGDWNLELDAAIPDPFTVGDWNLELGLAIPDPLITEDWTLENA